VLDISGEVGSNGNEEGLLGLAFSPSGTELYLYFTDRDGAIRVVEYAVREGTVDGGSRRDVLTVAHPQSNHNGGQLAFGPDGLLYIGTGDGGNAGDVGPGHVEGGNAQSTGTLLGKILRIAPLAAGGAPYTIPPGNPFAAGGGEPEIFALGLRNPWRFSFDRETGDLWIGDVGQNVWEEIDMLPAGTGAGANFGWNRLEGTHEFGGDPPEGAVSPVLEYSHDGGNCSVTGGYVYRGAAIPDLRGAYVFADYCAGELRAYGGPGVERFLDVHVPDVSSFGEDASGELYVLSDAGGLYRLDPAP
jgi:glucose/arabinose dehydrogenase